MRIVLLDRNRHTADVLFESVLTAGLAGIFLFVAFFVSRGIAPSEGGGLMWILPGIFGLLAVGFGFSAAWHYFGREVIDVGRDTVQATRFLGPFKRQSAVTLADITSVEAPAVGREFVKGAWGVGLPSLFVRTPRKTLRCCIAVPPRYAERVGAIIWEAAQNAAASRTTTRCS